MYGPSGIDNSFSTHAMHALTTLDRIALSLLIIGGVNWGLIGFFEFDLISALFGPVAALSKIIYGLVGLSALYVAAISPDLHRHETYEGRRHRGIIATNRQA
ncbi:MAG: hypothetical protein JWM56_90 [Candidatus Peribacteria bacterium]|nr:hypothetical protein [Candidatus Peribacteria bacterium]